MKRNLYDFIIQNFKKAIGYHEIQVYYQPVIRTSSRQLCSFEALARWIDPALGMIYPDEFIPVLEREGLIHLLDLEILRQVCARQRNSITNGETLIPVSVNLSRLDFTLCDIFTLADNIVSDYLIPHEFIYFEITESVMANQKELVLGIVDRFRAAGYQVWMDDFGSAYSSLNVLKDFNFDELKLDMSFLHPFNLRSKRIVTAVVKMAKGIDIHTLAEGVETEEQFAYLRDIGCEKAQGYYFGKPLPYDEALAGLTEKGIQIETPHDRHYYDEIGRIDFLSAIPFMTWEESNTLTTAGQLNSIPLALIELSADSFKVLFYNTAFAETVRLAGMFTRVVTQEMLSQSQPYHMFTRNIINLLDSVATDGDGKMMFTVNEQYFEVRARRMAQTEDKTCVLIGFTNLTKDTQSEKTGYLDDSIRQIYALYERITHMNFSEDSIRPLYTDTREDMLSNRRGIKKLIGEYAERYIFPEDRDRFIRAFNPDLATDRLRESGSVSFSEVFRTAVRHGQYAWKEYTLLKIDEHNYFMLVRNTHDIVKSFIEHNEVKLSEGGLYSPEQLWNNLVRSDLVRVFWKDRDRRFLGVNRGFLDFYGFSSAGELIGKNDEEMGWHVHPDLYKNDEYRVIHEGVTIRNVHGKCMSLGENKDIYASKMPLYDENGEITGLLGFFTDINSPNVSDQQGHNSPNRDLLTGLLNSRGISEDAESFQDEYYLRGTDFVRMHIEVNDFTLINEQYGFDFGDKVLYTLGSALKKGLGTSSSIGRYAGSKFAVLRQVASKEDARQLREKVKAIGDSIHEIDGNPVTLYLSVGYTRYSECLDLDKLARNTEMRIHADSDRNISEEIRIDHASELFSMFDDLPVPYAVFHMTYAERSGRYNAVFFYVNHKFEEFASLEARAMLGHTVRELFPYLGDDWHNEIKSAALDGNVVEGEYDSPLSDRSYRFTARQIIYPGYCAITCIETPVRKTRQTLLIADDAETDRALLGRLLSDDYDICYARDGVETLETLKKNKGKIDLLMLDLHMPKTTGQEVLALMQADVELQSVPVIVLTSDKKAELESLKMGAMDFIPKPYPDIEIVKARIAKCIKLSERR